MRKNKKIESLEVRVKNLEDQNKELIDKCVDIIVDVTILSHQLDDCVHDINLLRRCVSHKYNQSFLDKGESKDWWGRP